MCPGYARGGLRMQLRRLAKDATSGLRARGAYGMSGFAKVRGFMGSARTPSCLSAPNASRYPHGMVGSAGHGVDRRRPWQGGRVGRLLCARAGGLLPGLAAVAPEKRLPVMRRDRPAPGGHVLVGGPVVHGVRGQFAPSPLGRSGPPRQAGEAGVGRAYCGPCTGTKGRTTLTSGAWAARAPGTAR